MGGEFTYPKMRSQNGFDDHCQMARISLNIPRKLFFPRPSFFFQTQIWSKDEIHTIVGAGGTGDGGGAIDAGNIMKPALSRGELQVGAAKRREKVSQGVFVLAGFMHRPAIWSKRYSGLV